MAHIVLCWEIGAGFGHLMPLRLLARHSRERGHRVTAVVRTPEAGSRLLAPLGVEVMAAPILKTPPRRFSLSLNYADNLRRNGYWHQEALRGHLRTWRELLRALKPDLLIADHSPAALLASRDTGYPRTAFGVGFTLPPLESPMPTLQPWFPIRRQQLADREDAFLADANGALDRLSLPPLGSVAAIFDDVTRFPWIHPELDHYAAPRPEPCYGPLIDAQGLADAHWSPKAADGADGGVFVYMSRENRFLVPVLQDLAARHIPVLAYVRGPAPPVAAANIRYLDTLVNLDRVADGCRAAVIQGGVGSLWTFLRHAVPTLICPFELEQAQLAYRLKERELAWSLGLFTPASEVSNRLDVLLEDAPPAGLEAFAEKYARHDPDRAAEAVLRTCETSMAQHISSRPAPAT